jgi:uncharacterized protein YsxB (DUF464 family)
MELVRQQQQEMIQKLALAQQQVAKQQAAQQQAAQPIAMTTPPLPGMTTQAIQARLNEQLTTMTTTLQRQQQALAETLTQGDVSTAVAVVMAGRVQAMDELLRAKAQEFKTEAQRLRRQMEELSQYYQTETVRLKELMNQYNEAASLASNMTKSYQDMTTSIIRNIQ